MSQRKQAGSGGKTERAIFFLAGCLMGILGALTAWFCYRWAISPLQTEHRWIWVTVSAGLSFFMLRGAYYTVIPQKKEKKFEITYGAQRF